MPGAAPTELTISAGIAFATDISFDSSVLSVDSAFMNFRCKGFKGERTLIASLQQRPDLPGIIEPIGAVDEHAMGIAHIGNGNGRIADPGNVNEAGQLREGRRFAGKVMVEGVVDKPEGRFRAEFPDCLGRLCLRTQRADLETERLDKTDNAGFL